MSRCRDCRRERGDLRPLAETRQTALCWVAAFPGNACAIADCIRFSDVARCHVCRLVVGNAVGNCTSAAKSWDAAEQRCLAEAHRQMVVAAEIHRAASRLRTKREAS